MDISPKFHVCKCFLTSLPSHMYVTSLCDIVQRQTCEWSLWLHLKDSCIWLISESDFSPNILIFHMNPFSVTFFFRRYLSPGFHAKSLLYINYLYEFVTSPKIVCDFPLCDFNVKNVRDFIPKTYACDFIPKTVTSLLCFQSKISSYDFRRVNFVWWFSTCDFYMMISVWWFSLMIFASRFLSDDFCLMIFV